MVLYFEFFFTFFFTFLFVGVTKAFWSNEIGKRCLSKDVQRIRSYLNLSFYNDWIGTYGVISISCDGIIFQTFFFTFLFVGVTKAFWSNEIGKRCLSKVVQRIRSHSNLSFYNDWIGTYGVISISCDGIIFQTFFFTFLFVGVTKAFWSNEIGERCLSKVVQRIRSYSNLSFYNDWIGTYGVISISCDGIIFQTFFFTFLFVGITKAFWSNETGKRCLSKVVQSVRSYLNLSFYNDWIGTYRVISISCDGIIF